MKCNLETTTTTTTKSFIPGIWGRLHEPKENYASFLLNNMPSLRPLAICLPYEM